MSYEIYIYYIEEPDRKLELKAATGKDAVRDRLWEEFRKRSEEANNYRNTINNKIK